MCLPEASCPANCAFRSKVNPAQDGEIPGPEHCGLLRGYSAVFYPDPREKGVPLEAHRQGLRQALNHEFVQVHGCRNPNILIAIEELVDDRTS
ncbi:hypothetical protein JW978_03185 [Candidatus Dojkabacteria bacterium]|nr:hypothetical protein [Candidatus Dojkabacteria bacterium]